jgi:hypothetical protein
VISSIFSNSLGRVRPFPDLVLRLSRRDGDGDDLLEGEMKEGRKSMSSVRLFMNERAGAWR